MDWAGEGLAASRRMGRPKALIERDDETFLARIVRVLVEGGATEIRIVVGGPHRESVEALLHPVDIPGIEPRDVAGLIARAGSDPSADAVVPSHAMRRGHPLLLWEGIARRIIAFRWLMA